ncbi:MAG TPA: DUF3857 domain-containing protein [Terriglobales bacterium]|nr:DUF3857 domain-containing protein [Terriglobales bacterium]
MRRCFAAIFLAGISWAQLPQSPQPSAELLFIKSDSTAALNQSEQELSRNPADLNARFVHMEAARLQLRTREELTSALVLLRDSHGADPRARLAAERVRELAANTADFRSAVPEVVSLLRHGHGYSRELTEALLAARADGVSLPRGAYLARRIRNWQIAGPFGELSNVDFDQSWPPEADQLRNTSYAQRIREDLDDESGELQLPDYFPQSGVYYAASDFALSRTGSYKFTIQSNGTYEVQLDGKPLLLHDARFRQQNDVSRVETVITAGRHRVLVKMQVSAFPLRVWIDSFHIRNSEELAIPEAEQRYLTIATSLLDGETRPALLLPSSASSISLMLRADAFSKTDEDQMERESLVAASVADPGNALADFRTARLAFDNERFEEAATYFAKVFGNDSSYYPAEELKYQVASHFAWARERQQALTEGLALHPNCGAFLDAEKVYQATGDTSQASKYDVRLATCSPRPSQLWDRLSQKGDHRAALASVNRYLATHPHDRRALEIAIRESILADERSNAQIYAQALHDCAPNWDWAAQLVSNPEKVLDSRSAYAPSDGFYKPYVRDPRPMMIDSTAEPSDSRVLINDRVVRLDHSGSAWVYEHTVTQVFDKKGIEELGEVELPHASDLLNLRTIKRDGTVVEPDISDNKGTVSMPSLSDGDAIEIAYVRHFNSEALASSPELLDFVFASTQSPTLSSRLTIICENALHPMLWQSPGIQQIRSEQQDSLEITSWEAHDLIPPPEEPASPHYENSPRILWLSTDASRPSNVAQRYRDELIEATRITPRIQQVADTFHGLQPRPKIAAAYQYVMSTVEDESQHWRDGSLISADESLGQADGNRAVTLVAVLAAMDFQPDLEIVAELGGHDPAAECVYLRCYTHPLVRVVLPKSNQEILLDPQLQGLAAGELSPEVEGQPALLVSRLNSTTGELASIPRSTNQRSFASADLQLDEHAGIRGSIHIRFGSLRGAQMRDGLRSLSAKERQSYFEEIAGRILPNASQVSGTVIHEQDSESPLELEIKTATSPLGHWNGADLELGQLIPALGLRRLYATLPERSVSLLLETPLIEDSQFTVHLPPGTEASRLPEAAELKSSFGEYHTDFKLEGDKLKIVRSFRIPVQEVSPADYSAFSEFALRIDNAEREQLELHRGVLAHNGGAAPMPPLH